MKSTIQYELIIFPFDFIASGHQRGDDSLAQLAALQIPNLMVAGSNPVRVKTLMQALLLGFGFVTGMHI